METITTISVGNGKLLITKRDKSKLEAYTRRMEDYEKYLFKKYGKEFMLRITPAEYKKAMGQHNDLFNLIQKVKKSQKSLKKQVKK